MTRYHIPKTQVRTEIRVSNSRFLTTIASAFEVKEAQAFLRRIRDEMPDASHHVYAFKIGYGSSVSEGMSDDGEPSGTAGPPTLAVLRGADIGDVVLVTTRYFGGTKLGTGGLVAAYSESAKVALAALETEEKVNRLGYEMTIPYSQHGAVRRALDDHQAIIDEESFQADVSIRFQIAEEQVVGLVQALDDLSAGKIVLSAYEQD